jgi:glycosyltransferase involved in cell wall biosynthesis
MRLPEMVECCPRVSVVMSVYNDASRLEKAVSSILEQTYANLEMIVVNDGSRDGSGELLDRLASADTRLRVIHQENSGLTRALIRGCSQARGEFIARQDSDDWSHPLRIAEQLELIDSDPRIGFVSCATQYVGPADEPLLVVSRPADPEEATRGLLLHRQGPPAHGSVLFRKFLYEEVGGYREEFYFSQDSDLWLRFAERAWIGYVAATRYVHRKDMLSTSGAKRPAQRRFAEIGHLCRQAREAGGAEFVHLEQARRLATELRMQSESGAKPDAAALSAAAYLLGSLLVKNRDARARSYLIHVVRVQPMHWKAWVRLIQSFLSSKSTARNPGREAQMGNPWP